MENAGNFKEDGKNLLTTKGKMHFIALRFV
jgi:hypothetical protein